ncbi:beta strand repeat-containing protein [Shewanella sp. 10N.286.51.B2]|uniref:beta strand repeat-containing protein n=1 Tax=Shewanella sp. 10N.286.51.B2 TaxID=3229707 RepID=UPI0035533072
MRSAQRLFLALLSSIFLFACSGGGSISDDGSGGTDPDPSVISITLDISTTDISFDSPALITATVTDSIAGALANQVVAFTLDDPEAGIFDPVSASVKTNSEGVASITLSTSSQEVATLLTASLVTGESDNVGVSFSGDGAIPGGNSIEVSLIDNTQTVITHISHGVPGYLEVTYKSPEGNALANELVVFSLNDSALAIFDPLDGTVLTNAQGKATIKVATQFKEGAGTVNVVIGENTSSVNFSSQGDAPRADQKVLSASLKDSSGSAITSISASSPGYVHVNYSDTAGVAQANQVISFSLNDTALGAFDPVDGTVLTDSQGDATIKLVTLNKEGAGSISISAGTDATLVNFSSVGDGVLPGNNIISVAMQDVAGNTISNISNAVPGYINVSYTDASGTPVANKVVSFTLNDSELASFVPGSGTALTDASGVASIKVVAANKEGAGNVTITIGDEVPSSISFYSKGDGGVADIASLTAVILDSSGNSTTEISDTEPGLVEVTYLDVNGNPVPSAVVNFSLNDTSIGIFDPTSATALTDANGKASIILRTADVEAAGTVNVSVAEGLTTSISFKALGDGPAVGTNRLSIKLFDVNGTEINQISNAVAGIVQATYLDLEGNPLTDKVATFKTSLGNITPSLGTAITDTNGVASIKLTAGEEAGAGEVQVVIGNATASLGFESLGDEVVIKPIDEYQIELTVVDSSDNIIRNISESSPGSVKATLLKQGVAVAYERVDFSIIGEGKINPSSGSALTDVNGIARATLLTDTVEGAGTLEVVFILEGEQIFADFNFSVAGDAFDGNGEVNNLDIALVDVSGNQTSTVSQAEPAKVQVFVTDRTGNPVVNQVISFASTLGDFLPVSATALSDNSGKAEILLTAGSIEGAASITASLGANEVSIGFETAGDDIDIVAADPSISFEIYDCNDVAAFDKALKNFEVCTVTDNITNERPGILGAIVTLEGSSQPLRQVLISAGTTLGAVSPASATAITNEDGKAILDLYSDGAVGAGEVSLKVKQVTSTKAFEIGRVDIDLDVSTYIGTGTIPAGGSTVIEVTVLDSVGAIETSQPFTLEFSSQCMSAGNAVIDSPVVTNAGKGFATYRSINCQGTDTITVSAITGASTVTATTDVMIDAITVGAIQFISASPTKLAIKGSGGLSDAGERSETSQVSFKLLNEVGQAAAAKRVCFELSTEVGGMTLSPAPIADDFVYCPNMPKVGDPEYPTDLVAANKYAVAYTDSEGNASVTVRSGYVATPVKVFAVWQDESDPSSLPVSNVSDSLTVTTGLADYNSFSLSASVLNVEGWDRDGETSAVTIRSADHFNNPVPTGTVIHFRTEGGNVGQGDLDGSCTTVSNTGTCSVIWTSSNPRPFDDRVVECPTPFIDRDGTIHVSPPCTGNVLDSYKDGDNSIIPEPRPGRSTVTAYAIGEESFVDLNGNGLFDAVETWTDITEAFFDENEDGSYRGDPVPAGAIKEEYIDYNSNGVFDAADDFYTGLLCASGSEASCSQTGINNTQSQLNVFRNMTIVMSGSTPYGRLVDINDVGDITDVATIDISSVFLDDDNDPSTPDVDVGLSSKTVYLFLSDVNNNTLASGTTITASTENGELSSATSSYTIGNNTSNKPLLFTFTIGRESSSNDKTDGNLTITVKTLYGDPVTYTVNVHDNG